MLLTRLDTCLVRGVAVCGALRAATGRAVRRLSRLGEVDPDEDTCLGRDNKPDTCLNGSGQLCGWNVGEKFS